MDLRQNAEGALAFAAWLASVSREDTFIPAHVLVAEHLQAVLQRHHLAEVQDAAKVAMKAQIEKHDTDGHFADPILIEGGTAEGRLEIVREERSANVLVVNRFATESRRRLRRLGRVARRSLRALRSPVITCPPGLTVDRVGKGPVVVSTNLTEECGQALKFGADLAKRTGRKLVVATVRRLPDQQAPAYLGDQTASKVAEARKEEAGVALTKWIEDHGVTVDDQAVLLGEVVTNITDYAAEQDACVIVAGSRLLSKIERMFLTSVGRGLSAVSTTPVAIVPPKDAEAQVTKAAS
ncbi:MAG: universal stress protein [Myxococcota bacterium]